MTGLTPVVIGRYLDSGMPRFYPVSEPEMQRAMRAYLRVIDTYGLPPRAHVLVVSLASEVATFMPLERALAERDFIISNADASVFDAARVEMFSRRFNVAAVFGVTEQVVKGLLGLGHDPRVLFRDRIVLATPQAYVQLAPADGFRLRLWTELGPAVGLECVAGKGIHIASDEWHLDEQDGQILLTSRWSRILSFTRHPTGLRGTIDRRPCSCGSLDVRVQLGAPNKAFPG